MSGLQITASLKREIVLLTAWLFFMFVLGALNNSTLAFLLIGLLIYVTWNLYNLNQLTRWLAKPSKQTPEVIGIWDEVYYQLYHLYKRQRKSRRKLASILNRFQESTQALPYATIILNAFNEIEWFNPAASQMFDLHSSIDIGQRIDNLIRQPEFSRYLSKTDFSEPLRIQINQKKIAISITPYGNGQYLISARDITSRSQLDDMRRDFISNASHELRTPLTVMSGYVEFLQHQSSQQQSLQQQSLQQQSKESENIPLEKIQQQITRMNKIIAELIELARLESSSAIDFTDEVDAQDLLNEVYNEALTFDNSRHNIELIIRRENTNTNTSTNTNANADTNSDDNAVKLYGSRSELRMAFSNLLTNAIRYTPDGGDIKLLCDVNEASVSIAVQDSGIGIAYQHITRLTERFYRVDEGRSREQGGTGLGLAIVKHVLDRHNASLHIQSKLGEGSTFRCNFSVLR